MNLKDFYYELPNELIAQTPLAQRDTSRLMLLNRTTGSISHKAFSNILDYLNKGDCLVLNDTRVIPARLMGKREDSDKPIEFLLLNRSANDTWEVILRPGKRGRIGHRFVFGNGELRAEIIGYGQGGNRIARFEYEGVFEQLLDRLGQMPLPHYITKRLEDKERYQTVYSKNEGSAAAPTAGLHFTDSLLDKVRQMGVEVAFITLHVGLGTFRPVKVEDITAHEMHAEYYSISQAAADKINSCKKAGGRIIAVGTTGCRTLEAAADQNGIIPVGSSATKIFIYPGYKFKAVDGLITNFHLPESTLIMLVSAFAGYDNTMSAYKTAVNEQYRFFSFGDAMMII